MTQDREMCSTKFKSSFSWCYLRRKRFISSYPGKKKSSCLFRRRFVYRVVYMYAAISGPCSPPRAENRPYAYSRIIQGGPPQHNRRTSPGARGGPTSLTLYTYARRSCVRLSPGKEPTTEGTGTRSLGASVHCSRCSPPHWVRNIRGQRGYMQTGLPTPDFCVNN